MHLRPRLTVIRLTATALAAGLALAIVDRSIITAVRAQTPASTPATRTTINVSKLGPQVGEQVPDFSLTDQNGKVWTRDSIMGPKGAMLVFIRSADW